MKAIYVYASRFRAFWVLLPISLVLTLSVRYNDSTTNLLKLYPLIIFSACAIIFTFIFLFRFVKISYSEIKYIGRFTTRDSATINEGKTLVIEFLEKKRISIRLYGNEGYNPEIKWLTDSDGESGDICLFRSKVYHLDTIALLDYFGVHDNADIDAILGENNFTKKYDNVTVSTLTENEHKKINIRFDKTV